MIPILLLLFAAADLSPDLLMEAAKGDTARVQTLLKQGANIEAADKERTHAADACGAARPRGHGAAVARERR